MKANKNRGGFMIYYKYMTDEHGNRLPFVRIKKVELTTFKGVKHGILEFNCAKENIPYNTKSDIMGLYGQNGSGKSSLVDALNIIKELMYGFKLDDDCVRFIDVETGYSIITIVFDFQYDNFKRTHKLLYSCCNSFTLFRNHGTNTQNACCPYSYCLSDSTYSGWFSLLHYGLCI